MAIKSKRDVDNLHKLINNLKKMKQTIALVGEKYLQETRKQWKKGQSVDGHKFPPLSPAYRRFKVNNNRAGKPDMELSGMLLKSLRSQIVNKGVRISVRTDYAKYLVARNDYIWGMSSQFRRRILKFIYKRLSPV